MYIFILSLLLILCLGVSHLTVPDDFAGVMAILDWLAFVPKVSHTLFTDCISSGFAITYLFTYK